MRSPYYLSVDGEYGLGPYRQPDYPTLGDLLRNMERLGVWQMVVSHNAARDLHPVYGNRFLLEDIHNTPGAAERIIPALAANPGMLVGNGEIEYLENCLERKEARCIALFPVTNRYRFLEIIPVLERVKKYRPVVLVDINELKLPLDMEDLVQAANAFPELHFVLRKVMWGQLSLSFNALNRTNNLYLDTSLLHTRDAIKIVRDHVGAHRLVFGLGAKAHAGAAISGLAFAKIDQTERDQIGWDNFVSLLADEAYHNELKQNRKHLDFQIKNRFWNNFMDGKGIRDALVIDAHTHIGPFARSWLLTENELDGQIAQFEEDMAVFGIDKVCSQSEIALFGSPLEGNRMLEEAIGNRKDRFRGNLVINPLYAEKYTEEVLDKFFSGGYFCGMKLIPQYIGVDIGDPCLVPIFNYADQHKMHILVHTWENSPGTALRTAETARNYPNATFILGHAGGGTEGRRQCEALAQNPQYDNCVFEFCGSFTTNIAWEETLQKIDYRRVVFGTDTIVHDVAWEMGRLLSLDLPDEWLEAILGANMQRVLDRTEL